MKSITMKRILSLLLVLVMVGSIVPAAAFATEVPTLPTATVKEISNPDMTFAMNFKTNDITAEQLAYYGNWYADFVLTTNKPVTFNANGNADGYLSGQYDKWSANWVNVPSTNVSLAANESLRIMEYAAELLGKKGLKYTYAEVYNDVKDFDCGIFFTPEFLAANPDLEVTLELRMFNPANEEESYVIGETYTFNIVSKYCAQNTNTGALYSDIQDAIYEANAGDTIILLDNITVRELSVFEDITVDLNGFSLTSIYVNIYGNMVDNSESNSGRLVVEERRVMFKNSNKQIPMKTDSGYAFVEIEKFNIGMSTYNKLVFQPFFEAYGRELLSNGGSALGVSIQVQIQWTVGSETRTQIVTYNDQLVQSFIQSYIPSSNRYSTLFSLTIASPELFENLTYTAQISSCSVVQTYGL